MIQIIVVRDGIQLIGVHVTNDDRVFVAVGFTDRGVRKKVLRVIKKWERDNS